MRLTKKHTEVAEALSLARESMEDIAKAHGICRATIYNWMADEDFSSFMGQLEKKHKRMALFIAGRWATEAVKRLIMNFTKKDCDPEIARKSAMDLLGIAGLKIDKIEGEGFGSSTIVIVRSDGNKATSESENEKTEALSGRLRLQ